MSYDCPHCGSSQTASFEMLYKAGTSSGNISGLTVGSDVGFTNARFDSQTSLANELSPPVAPKMGCGIQLLIAVGALLATFMAVPSVVYCYQIVFGPIADDKGHRLVILVFASITGFLIYGLHLYNRFIQRKRMPVYREQARKWSNSMICRRCGYTWTRN